ncbi:MAG: (2Fe-2S)-binding protein [Acidimicrobiales bacterium]|nr:MAG: (2Fe-2S)-binding protein [Acidimicrobiales bacterium]
MIHCLCNQINTKKVDEAAACGARRPKCVQAHFGHKFNCGKCAQSIRERLAEISGVDYLEAAE